jgi:hypothetical protein
MNTIGFTVPNVECPRCHQKIEVAFGASPEHSQTFHKGQIFVCGHCALITRVGDSKLIPMSKKEIMTMEPRTQQQLWICCQTIKRQQEKN